MTPAWSSRVLRLLAQPSRLLARPLRVLARLFGLESLPTRFNGEWIRVPSPVWPGVRVRYEHYIARLLPEYLMPGDTFVDVGANFGFWSLYAAKLVGSLGRVIAFEPAPEVYQILLESSRPYKVLTPLNVGLGSDDTIATFAAQGTSDCSSFCRQVTDVNRHWRPRVPVVEVPVRMRRLDAVVEELKLRPAAIKIDVEGYELEVLRGAEQTLSKLSCPLFIEVHPYQLGLSGGSEDLLRALLAAHGYSWTVVNENPNSLYTLLATKRDTAQRRVY